MDIEISAPNSFDDVRRKLDLGGTAQYESPFCISISLDGSTSGDEIVHNLIGDYNDMPMFADETFDEAVGSCYLEEKPNWYELFRVLAPGAKAIVKACDRGYASIDRIIRDAQEAGFILVQEGVLVIDAEDGDYFDAPFIFRKPE